MRPVKSLLLLIFLIVGQWSFSQENGGSSPPGDPGGGPPDTSNGDAVTAAFVPIEGDIDQFQVVFLRRSIEKAEKMGVDYIIFSINTFGGRVDSALQMATLIGSLDEMHTIAFIPAEPESVGVSWSAGALISFASASIYMAPGTSIGAAAPVYQSAEGMEPAGEKTVSAVRAQLAALAEKNGYPPEVAIAMVDQDVELVAVAENGAYRFELRNRSGGETGTDTGPADNEEIISPSGKLLTLTAGQMQKYGLSSGTVSDVEELQGELGITRLERIVPSSTDVIINFLTSAAVASLLLTIGLVALYMEISSPGFGIPGTVAIIVFSLMFASSGLMGTLNSAELLLFLAGLILLIVEVFLIPGFGVAGITGLIFMTVGLVLSRQGFFLPDTDWQWDILTRNLMMVIGTIAASFVLMAVLMVFFPRIRLFRRLILSSVSPTADSNIADSGAGPGVLTGHGGGTIQGAGPGAVTGVGPAAPTAPAGPAGLDNPAASGSDHEPIPEAAPEIHTLIGTEGLCITKLRPAGKIQVGDEIYSVVTDGRWVQPGQRVRITAVEGNRIVVEEIPS